MAREDAAADGGPEGHAAGRHSDDTPTDEWFPLVYDCLRDLAAQWFRRESPDHTLQPTAFVHEAYLRLVQGRQIDCRDEKHFFALAATVMRRVIVDHARRRTAARRGGDREKLTLLDGDGAVTLHDEIDILAVDEALRKLSADHERPGRIVELRFFTGLTIDETAAVLGVSPRTVDLDWRFARAWLMRELEMEAA